MPFLSKTQFLALPLAAVIGFSSVHAGPGTNTIIAPVASTPGVYDIINRSAIETQRIEWGMLLQKQDEAQYQTAVRKAEEAYLSMYNLGLSELRKFHNVSVLSKEREIPVSELNAGIDRFIAQRDQFSQALSALDVVADVWKGLAAQPSKGQNSVVDSVYKRGSINLQALTTTYRDGIKKMTDEANALTYRYKDGTGSQVSLAGLGLQKVGMADTPEVIQRRMQELQENSRLTSVDIQKIGRSTLEIKRHMAEFVNANDMKLYWLNSNQQGTRQAWIDSLQKYARLTHFIRANFCMQAGVPAISLPELKSFNRGYFSRDFASRIRLAEKAEFDSAVIRKVMPKFDELFASLQSQSGELNGQGGVMGFLHKVNSTLSWQNEVYAYYSIMKIIRDMYLDEADIADGAMEGCEKVRERYYSKYVTLKDEKFNKDVQMYLLASSSANPIVQAFNMAGSVIIPKGKFQLEYRKLVKQNPSVSPLMDAVMNNDETR